jgi:uncharacterized protein
MSKWKCVSGCGACCNLDPSSRPDLEDYLSPEQLATYLSMVGEDGWCINFNKQNRDCQIYADRPSFCRVQADTFQAMFGIEPEDLEDFAIECCHQQIEDVYGDQSLEMLKFDREIGFIRIAT